MPLTAPGLVASAPASSLVLTGERPCLTPILLPFLTPHPGWDRKDFLKEPGFNRVFSLSAVSLSPVPFRLPRRSWWASLPRAPGVASVSPVLPPGSVWLPFTVPPAVAVEDRQSDCSLRSLHRPPGSLVLGAAWGGGQRAGCAAPRVWSRGSLHGRCEPLSRGRGAVETGSGLACLRGLSSFRVFPRLSAQRPRCRPSGPPTPTKS